VFGPEWSEVCRLIVRYELPPKLYCEHWHLKGYAIDLIVVSVESDVVALAWVTFAFEYALKQNQTRLVPYLIDVSEELVFEMEMAARRASLLPQPAKQTT
jgi:hypothetical protein